MCIFLNARGGGTAPLDSLGGSPVLATPLKHINLAVKTDKSYVLLVVLKARTLFIAASLGTLTALKEMRQRNEFHKKKKTWKIIF